MSNTLHDVVRFPLVSRNGLLSPSGLLDAEYYCWESDLIVSAGVLGMLSETCLHNRKRIATFVVYMCTLLMQMTLLKGISLG